MTVNTAVGGAPLPSAKTEDVNKDDINIDIKSDKQMDEPMKKEDEKVVDEET